MKISELPAPIRAKAEEYGAKMNNPIDDRILSEGVLVGAFIWSDTNEGYCFWRTLDNSNSIKQAFSRMSEQDKAAFRKMNRYRITPDVEVIN